MIWCTICAVNKGKVESVEILGPFDDVDELDAHVRRAKKNLRSEGLRAYAVPFELCSDDVPEVVHALT